VGLSAGLAGAGRLGTLPGRGGALIAELLGRGLGAGSFTPCCTANAPAVVITRADQNNIRIIFFIVMSISTLLYTNTLPPNRLGHNFIAWRIYSHIDKAVI
jgi:hypothetical protein